MNLTVDPWIPALCADGGCRLFSLQELFASAHELRDLAVKPHERIALMRLLICITQAALDGPTDEDDWGTSEARIQASVKKYLKQWQDEFNLLGEGKRFLQLAGLSAGKCDDEGSASTKLDLALSTGNSATLFDNLAGDARVIEHARAGLNLLTFQCFSPGGRIGVAKWNGVDTPGKGSSNHAPCTPSSMVHALVMGQDMLATLRLNCITKEIAIDAYGKGAWGMPIWEKPVRGIDDRDAIQNATKTYLGRLVPCSRAIRLREDGISVLLANGLEYPIFPAYREATATIVLRKKEELALLPASAGRSFWRQLAAVAVKSRGGGTLAGGPLALRHLSGAEDNALWVGAMLTDKAKIEDVVEASYSLPRQMFGDFGRMAYEGGVRYAEERESGLSQAVKSYASSLKIASPDYEGAKRRFWTRLEQHLSALFDVARDLTSDQQLPESAWGKAAHEAASEAYEQSCPRQNPRQIQAYALGLRKLNFTSKSTKAKES